MQLTYSLMTDEAPDLNFHRKSQDFRKNSQLVMEQFQYPLAPRLCHFDDLEHDTVQMDSHHWTRPSSSHLQSSPCAPCRTLAWFSSASLWVVQKVWQISDWAEIFSKSCSICLLPWPKISVQSEVLLVNNIFGVISSAFTLYCASAAPKLHPRLLPKC